MSDLVPAEDIEHIVGVTRHRSVHYGRIVQAARRVYVLHSRNCLDSGIDLRDCPYSQALDRGLDERTWSLWVDVPVALRIYGQRLIPIPIPWREAATNER